MIGSEMTKKQSWILTGALSFRYCEWNRRGYVEKKKEENTKGENNRLLFYVIIII
jgi:hypothetical protein